MSKQEYKRQFMHMLIGSNFIGLVLWLGVETTLLIAFAMFLLGVFVHLAVKAGFHVPVLYDVVLHIERDHEKHIPAVASTLFVLSVCILLFFFKRPEIVLGALAALAYGDSAATIIGKHFGRTKLISNRTLEGTFGGIVVSAIAIYLIIKNLEVSLIAATLGMLAEYLPIDDNFSVPLATAVALTLLL